jgi:adenylate cyclase
MAQAQPLSARAACKPELPHWGRALLHERHMEPAREIGLLPPDPSARALLRRMRRVYVFASLAALAILFPLIVTGLEFQQWQWEGLFRYTPLGFSFYIVIDLYMLQSHLLPVTQALGALDAGQRPDDDVLSAGITRALNLPFMAFLRVTFVHGPLATMAVCVAMLLTNHYAALGFETWQIVAFACAALFFAAPTHAIFEYFAVSRDTEGAIKRLSAALGHPLGATWQSRLIAIRLKEKLLYLAVAVASLPLMFFALSILFKVRRMFEANGLHLTSAQMAPLYTFIIGVVLVCALGSFSMALLTASEVSRSAARMLDAMGKVEKGRLDEAHLDVISTDEYAELFRGFGLMVDALREEQKILSVSHDLAGELKLDVLIARIMTAAADLLGAERSTLFVHDPKTNELLSVFAAGLETREIRVPADKGIAGAVFTSGRLENIADPYSDPRFQRTTDLATGFTTRNILCAPIANKNGGRIGVCQVLNKREGQFTSKDEARLRAFAAQIAVSLENARLFDDVLSMKNYNDSVLKSTSNAIVTLDGEQRVVTVNDPGVMLLGTAREDLVGQPCPAVFGPDNAWVMSGITRTAATGDTTLALDEQMRLPSGRDATVNATVTPLIDANDQRIGSMLVIEDITAERRVRATMARYMSKEVADQLLEAGEAELVGKDQEVTILFSDVRGFTNMSEAMGARETVALLNDYFTEMVDVIFEHGGVLDKYIGDAIMALFGAPFQHADDADRAVAVANAMMERLALLNARRAGPGINPSGIKPLAIGVGISTGEVVVGNIGSVKRMEYTVIGDSVNLASRLEGANKVYDTRILVGESTVGRLQSPALLREVDRVRVQGKDNPVSIFEALGWRRGEPGLDDLLGTYAAGLAAYRDRDWALAERQFAAALQIRPGDVPSAIHLDRTRAYAATAPPPDWDWVYTLTEK